jgi:hypothetical protein
MFSAIARLAEKKIREAQENGEFDNLPGQGRPLELDDMSRVPEDLRMSYIILKNAGCLPPEVMVKNEIVRIEDMLDRIKDEQEKYRQIKKLNYLITRLNSMRQRPVNLEEQQHYYSRIVDHVNVAKKSTTETGDK